MQCSSDREFTSIIRRLRAALPRPRYTLTAARWSVGAYGQGVWRDAEPIAARTGMSVNPLRAVSRGAAGLDTGQALATGARTDSCAHSLDPSQSSALPGRHACLPGFAHGASRRP